MISQVGEQPTVAVPIWPPYGAPMEPIPEEDHEGMGSTSTLHQGTAASPNSGREGDQMNTSTTRSVTPGTKRLVESKQRQREVYTSEQVDTLVR